MLQKRNIIFQYVETLITGPGMILVFNLLRVWREKAIDYQECPYRSPRGAFKGGGGTTTLETFKLSENWTETPDGFLGQAIKLQLLLKCR